MHTDANTDSKNNENNNTMKAFAKINLHHSYGIRYRAINSLIFPFSVSSTFFSSQRRITLSHFDLNPTIQTINSSCHPRTFFSQATNWKHKESPYDILGVRRDADTKAIKAAYYAEAKKCHPDLNPNNPQAKERFQRLASAYELLSDPTRRSIYDTTGDTTDSANYQQQQQQQARGRSRSHQPGYQYVYEGDPQKHAEEVFRGVFADIEVIKSALASYADELKSEVEYAAMSAREGKWDQVLDVVNANKGFIFGVVMPLIVLLRYPPLIPWALRLLLAGSQAFLLILIRTQNLSTAAGYLWGLVVRLAQAQKNRKARPPRRR